MILKDICGGKLGAQLLNIYSNIFSNYACAVAVVQNMSVVYVSAVAVVQNMSVV